MAFVYRSSKNFDVKKKLENNLPPLNNLEYDTLPDIGKKYYSKNNNIKSNHAPFGVKAPKESSQNKTNIDNPGPGSYQFQENFLKKSFNQNLTSPFDPESIEGTASQQFITKERRFKYTNKTDNDYPGPGEYIKENNKTFKIFEKKNNPQYPKPKIYKVYDPNRKISIPSDDFHFEIKDNGDVEVKQDIDEIRRWNNTGPGSYNVRYFTKNNNSIDWSRTVNDIKKNKNKENDKLIEDLDKLKINTQVNSFDKFNESLQTSNYGTHNSSNALNFNIKKMANKMCNTEIIDIEEKSKDKTETKSKEIPGPGDYDISPYINVPICFSNVTNFGSNSSRGLLYSKKENKILIGHKDKQFFAIIKNNNRKHKHKHNKSLDLGKKPDNKEIKFNKRINKKKLQQDSYKQNAFYINSLKERNLINKKILMDQLGPGSYDPSISFYKNKKDNDIQNFGVLEKRFKENSEDYPGVGSYSLQKSFIKKKSNYISPIPINISRKNIEGISSEKVQEMKVQLFSEKNRQPGVWDYFPEIANSMEYKAYKESKSSEKKPGFNNGEKRFFEPKYKYEDENQVGKYNLLYKQKEFNQQNSPFGSSAEKFDYKEERKQKGLGPGAYRIDSYFDWNKKSYNMLFNV